MNIELHAPGEKPNFKFHGVISLKDYWSPLKLACHAGLIDIVKLLIERGVDVNSLSEVSTFCCYC